MGAPFESGVVLFDSPEYPQSSSGVAVSADGERRFATFGDLPTGTTWWTNANYQVFKQSRIWQRANARNDQLLRMPQGQIIHELGLSFTARSKQADSLFQVLREAIQFVHTNYLPCTNPFQRLDWHLGGLLAISRRLSPTAPVLTAARSAHTYMSPSIQSGGHAGTSQETRTYCAPRVSRLPQILALPAPAPDAEWSFMEMREKIHDSKHLWSIAGPAALVEISVSNIDETLSLVAPFGALQRAAGEQRAWCPLPEAMFYADRSDLLVKGIWRASKCSQVKDFLKAEPVDNDFSFSAGLASEAVLYALLGITAANAAPTGREPMAAYVAAYDRLQMIQLAMKVYEAGFNPLSSSCGGRLVVAVSQPNIPELDQLCERLGLESPMSGI